VVPREKHVNDSGSGILLAMKQKVYIEISIVSYQIEVMVEKAGYACPVICTLEELMED